MNERRGWIWYLALAGMWLAGCAPAGRLTFPAQPLEATATRRGYDVDGSGKVGFALLADEKGKLDVLGYDDLRNGTFNRIYRLSDYSRRDVPHLVLLLDSLPYRTVEARWKRGDWPWFSKPAKVVGVFPGLTEMIFGKILHAAPQLAVTQSYYDVTKAATHNLLVDEAWGWEQPMDQLVDYSAEFKEAALTYLDPRPWYAAELERVRQAVNQNPRGLTIVYLVSSSSMICKYGERGANEVLDGMTRLCMQLFYERQGAIRISVLADHGHTYIAPKELDMGKALEDAGFRVTGKLKKPGDVVIDAGGLVNVVCLHTHEPEKVAAAMAARAETTLVAYLSGRTVIVRDRYGSAAIDGRRGRVRYRPIDRDVLGYAKVVKALRSEADADGFIDARAWLEATADEHYPDAPWRLWQCFHGLVVNPPDVVVNLDNEHCAGLGGLVHFITMASTHGGLDQLNTATFVMTMVPALEGPLRSEQVMRLLVPDYRPELRKAK